MSVERSAGVYLGYVTLDSEMLSAGREKARAVVGEDWVIAV
jgi:hypothetical protein